MIKIDRVKGCAMITNPKHILSTVLAAAVLAGFWMSSSSMATAGQIGISANKDTTNLSASLADDADTYFIFQVNSKYSQT